MNFDWNNDKNAKLKSTRHISFEQIVIEIEDGKLFDFLEHPNKKRHPNQLILIADIEAFGICVPCVIQDQTYFLKTLFPSRKYT